MGKPAAYVGASVAHPLPPVLTGSGCPTVLIGGLPAWRGVPSAVAAALQNAKQASEVVLKTAQTATLAASGTPGAPAAKAAEEATKASVAASMGSVITASGSMTDIHTCSTPLPIPPHGPGVVINASTTVMVGGLPLARMGDTILEAIGPPNTITSGCLTVLVGG